MSVWADENGPELLRGLLTSRLLQRFSLMIPPSPIHQANLPIQDKDFGLSSGVGDIHFRHHNAVDIRAFGVQRYFHVQWSPRLHCQLVVNQQTCKTIVKLSILVIWSKLYNTFLSDTNYEFRNGSPSSDLTRDFNVITAITNIRLELNDIHFELVLLWLLKVGWELS